MAVGGDSVLEAEKFPRGVSDLDSTLANVNGNDLSHERVGDVEECVYWFII